LPELKDLARPRHGFLTLARDDKRFRLFQEQALELERRDEPAISQPGPGAQRWVMTVHEAGFDRVVQHQTAFGLAGFQQREDDLQHADLEQAGHVRQVAVVEDAMQTPVTRRLGSLAPVGPRAAQGLVTGVHQRPLDRGGDACQCLHEVHSLTELVGYGRRAVLAAGLALPGENDAGYLIGGEIEHGIQLPVEDALPGVLGEQHVGVASEGVAPAVAVVREHDNALALGQLGVGGVHRMARDAQHGVPRGNPIVRTAHFGQADF